MKNPININPKSFILGLVFGCIFVFLAGADNHHSTAWIYKVVEQDVKYSTAGHYTDALNQSTTNGWEFVSAQIIPNAGDVFAGAKMMIILKQPKP